MSCDTYRSTPQQTVSQRKQEILAVVEAVQKGLLSRRIMPRVDKTTGAIAFEGLLASQRNFVTDACIYRRIMATGSSLAKMAIQKAEQAAGRTVSRQALAAGVHSHDGGQSWGTH